VAKKQVPVRYIGEQHVKDDLGRIPTVQDWISQLRPQRWMYGRHLELEASDADPRHAEKYSTNEAPPQTDESC